MTMALPGRHIQNEAPDNAEKFQTIVLLVLGLAFIGMASIALNFAGGSATGVAIGAGVVLAAGGISIFNAIVRSLFRFGGPFKNVISRRNSNHASHMPVARTSPTRMPRRDSAVAVDSFFGAAAGQVSDGSSADEDARFQSLRERRREGP